MAEGAAGRVVASRLGRGDAGVPLTPELLKLYKNVVAMHAVNGSESFGNPEAGLMRIRPPLNDDN